MTARDDEFALGCNLDEIIDRVAERLSRRFIWELRVRTCTQVTLILATGFAVIVAGDLLTLLALLRQSSETLSLISNLLS